MAYTKTVWQDHIVSAPNTYTMNPSGNGYYTILPYGGTVIQQGTPVNAANLNKIEDELEALDAGKLSLAGGTMTGALKMSGTSSLQRLYDSGANVAVAKDTQEHLRGAINIGSSNNWWFRNYQSAGSTVYEDYYLPYPDSNLASSISMDLVAKKSLGLTSSSAATSFTIPRPGKWMIVTTHASTNNLCGVWLAITGGSKIVNVGGGSGITFSLSGTTLSATATSGGAAAVYGIFLGP